MTVLIQLPHNDNNSPMVLYQNILEDGVLTASSETVDGVKESAIDGLTSDYWTPSALPASLEVDLGVGTTCDCAFIEAHTLGTVGATINVEKWNGATWVQILSHTPTDDQAILFIFAPGTADQWRFTLTGTTPPSIGVAMIGKRLVFPQGILAGYKPIYNAREIDVLSGNSIGGHFMPTRIVRKGASGSVNFAPFDRLYVEGDFEEFNRHYDDVKPFVFASGPATFTKDVTFCRRAPNASTISPSHPNTGDLMNVTLNVEAYVE